MRLFAARTDDRHAVVFDQRATVDIRGFEYRLLRFGQFADPLWQFGFVEAACEVQVLGRIAHQQCAALMLSDQGSVP